MIYCVESGTVAIRKTDVQGNANYVVHQPARYMYELRPDGTRRLVRVLLIRAFPRPHVATPSTRRRRRARTSSPVCAPPSRRPGRSSDASARSWSSSSESTCSTVLRR